MSFYQRADAVVHLFQRHRVFKEQNVMEIAFNKERLPSALEEKQKQVDYWGDRCCKAEVEIKRLRLALEEISNLGDVRCDEAASIARRVLVN